MKIIKEYKTPAAQDLNADMAEMLTKDNILVAGCAGSGKSVFLNTLIYNALATFTPAEIEYIFIDPKKVELGIYKELPNTITRVTTHAAAVEIIKKLYDVAEKRFSEMEKTGAKMWTGKHIIVFIDEIADLMAGAHGKQFAPALTSLLQICRAAGIRVVACTQSPNRKTIPAEIVCNFQSRIALRCVSAIESRQVINAAGAEKINMHGVAILLSGAGYSELKFDMTPEKDIKNRVEYWKRYKPEIYIKL